MHKNLILLFFLGFTLQLFGQDIINEAYVQYEITDVSSDDPQTESMLQMMKGSTIDIYFKDQKQRMDMDMMGGMMTMKTFMNLEDSLAPNAMFMDMMGRKIRVNMDDKELEEFQSNNKSDNPKPKIVSDLEDTKEISGFNCHKVTCTFEGDNGFVLVAYVTKEVQSPESVVQNAGQVDLGGFPLEYTVQNPQFNLTYSAQKFEKSVPQGTFEQPEGYEPMSFTDFIENMTGMGGMGQ
ncbi:MAG: DUF4412 domain-containing protein [Saprospiraceae bacterium]|nr:DUF4412 domain-containing protein [Saprospiraceae bacterium]